MSSTASSFRFGTFPLPLLRKTNAVRHKPGQVAGYLGNTPAVARAAYIDPRVIELYETGITIAPPVPVSHGTKRPAARAAHVNVAAAALRLLLHEVTFRRLDRS